jgi:hypothetical protein
MLGGHIGALPVEEVLLGLGGPVAAVYLAAIAIALRGTGRRISRPFRRR